MDKYLELAREIFTASKAKQEEIKDRLSKQLMQGHVGEVIKMMRALRIEGVI